MKNHGSLSLPFRILVLVQHFGMDTHRIMAACIFITLVSGSAELTELLPSKCCFTASSAANLVEICLQT
jgi:hypothetical protein